MSSVIVPESLMDKITALCDVIVAGSSGDAVVETARRIRREIDNGLDITD